MANKVTYSIESKDKSKKGLTSAYQNVKKFEGSVKGLSSNLVGMGSALMGAFAVKQIYSFGKALDDAWSNQADAERGLLNASKNNPYINGLGVENLKDYASYLQKTVNIGDEVAMSSMSQYVALGKTEDQIKDLMMAGAQMDTVFTDMSLDTALKQLNATTSGSIGTLGKYIPELKDLTTEQLKAGGAIDLVNEKFKGMAQSAMDLNSALDTGLSNSWGDLMEQMGKPLTENIFAPMKGWLKDVIDDLTTALSKKNELNDAKKAQKAGTETEDQRVTLQQSKVDSLGIQSRTLKSSLTQGMDMSYMYSPNMMDNAESIAKKQAELDKQKEESIKMILSSNREYQKLQAELKTENDKLRNLEQQVYMSKLQLAEKQKKETETLKTQEQKEQKIIDTNQKSIDRWGSTFADYIKTLNGTIANVGKTDSELKLEKYIAENSRLLGNLEAGTGTDSQKETMQAFYDDVYAPTVAQLEQLVRDERNNLNAQKALTAQTKYGNRGSAKGDNVVFSGFTQGGGNAVQGEGMLSQLQGMLAGGSENINMGASFMEGMGGLSSIVDSFKGSVNESTGSLITLTAQMGLMGLAVWAGQEVLQGFMSTVGPAIDQVLVPVVNILGTLGSTIGGVVTPVLSAIAPMFEALGIFLAPLNAMLPLLNIYLMPLIGIVTVLSGVVELVSKGMLSFYNYAIVPLTNGILKGVDTLVDGLADAYNGIRKIAKKFGVKVGSKAEGFDYSGNKLSTLNYDDLATALSDSDYSSAGTANTGVGSVSGDTYINLKIETQVIAGDDGLDELALIFMDRVKDKVNLNQFSFSSAG